MKPLPLKIPLPSVQRGDIKVITKILNKILTEETAKLLDRLADCAYIAGNSCRGYSGEEDEEAAYTLADHIRELVGRE